MYKKEVISFFERLILKENTLQNLVLQKYFKVTVYGKERLIQAMQWFLSKADRRDI